MNISPVMPSRSFGPQKLQLELSEKEQIGSKLVGVRWTFLQEGNVGGKFRLTYIRVVSNGHRALIGDRALMGTFVSLHPSIKSRPL